MLPELRPRGMPWSAYRTMRTSTLPHSSFKLVFCREGEAQGAVQRPDHPSSGRELRHPVPRTRHHSPQSPHRTRSGTHQPWNEAHYMSCTPRWAACRPSSGPHWQSPSCPPAGGPRCLPAANWTHCRLNVLEQFLEGKVQIETGQCVCLSARRAGSRSASSHTGTLAPKGPPTCMLR